MPSIDIRAFGDKELERQLGRIVDRTQKTIVAGALRKEATRVKDRIVRNIVMLGLFKTGNLVRGYSVARIRSAGGGKRFIRVGVENPDRASLDIAADDPYYYPYAVEFGHRGAEPKPFIRPAVDHHKPEAMRRIGQDIGKGIGRAVRRGRLQ